MGDGEHHNGQTDNVANLHEPEVVPGDDVTGDAPPSHDLSKKLTEALPETEMENETATDGDGSHPQIPAPAADVASDEKVADTASVTEMENETATDGDGSHQQIAQVPPAADVASDEKVADTTSKTETEMESETSRPTDVVETENSSCLDQEVDEDDERTPEEREEQRLKALEWLRKAVGNPEADFHEGQWEAIDAVANRHQKVIVIQRTGWGKSSVYFIATRLLREEQKRGPTLIISPLLALMRNQVEAAGKLGIRSATLNSSNPKEWNTITADILDDKIDVILLSPERLANESFRSNVLEQIGSRLGMLVIDEVHCISIWGHDFRPDYRRINSAISVLPAGTPILGTTATASTRVLEDVKAVLGKGVRVQRGTLLRSSLSLYVVHLPDTASRLAWLATNLRNMPLRLSGIIYTNTRHDADLLANWLVMNTEFRSVYAYYSGVRARRGVPGLDSRFAHDTDAYRKFLEQCLMENKIKALVATTALGMGFDKPDLGFIIHYQCPDSIVTYYQQVGRAGRGIDSALGVLMSGEDDGKLHRQLSEAAFPSKEEIDTLLEAMSSTSTDGFTLDELMERCNLRFGQIEKALRFLAAEDDSPVRKMLKPSIDTRERWIRNPLDLGYSTDNERIQRKISQRSDEWKEMCEFLVTQECLMLFIRRILGDFIDVDPCGKCSSCITTEFTFDEPEEETTKKAIDYVKNADIDLVCKKRVPNGGFLCYRWRNTLPKNLQARDGKILSLLNDGGYGSMVATDRAAGRFRDDLVTATVRLIKDRWRPTTMPTWATCVPTTRRKPDPVAEFTRRLALKLGIPFLDSVKKTRENKAQRLMQNRFYKCRNLDGAFKVVGRVNTGPCLLIDDLADSGWTMTVVAALLLQRHSGPVMPLALARVNAGD